MGDETRPDGCVECKPWCGLTYCDPKVPNRNNRGDASGVFIVEEKGALQPAGCSVDCRSRLQPPISPPAEPATRVHVPLCGMDTDHSGECVPAPSIGIKGQAGCPEPATWRGMRVGQVVGDRRVVAVDADSATTITRSGVRFQWSRKSPHDRVVVESWTLVSESERIQEPPPVPPRPAKECQSWCGNAGDGFTGYCSTECLEARRATAKAEPAKAVCEVYSSGAHSGPVLLRHFGPIPTRSCEGCYLGHEVYVAARTPFTPPAESPPPKAPRYPASNDVDQDIPDA